ncbi:uncharacterized protein FIBRA_06447 [Fibroporia radiculosa]|uniref:F-box domain-containing protein n=1 Tax=Fibroporia radiculosa TaxID=599839 RepID=J4IB96_9APHY|nr:uncharacterized protein FIBRA_06447 [Fibroporia radiculosa]CCM04276.1 predicted protein [Fibroporia radiculosa]
MSRRAKDLPIEVWGQVFDLLAQDEELYTLRRCALVCRRWAPRCLWHLARNVVVGRKHGHRVAKTMVANLAKAITFRQPTGFVVRRPNPSVETLTIGNHPYDTNLTAGAFHADVFALLRMAFPNVTRLVLSGVEFPSLIVFARLVYSFPRLVRLVCHGLRCQRRGYVRGRALPPKDLALTHLEIHESEPVIDFLVESLICRTLRHLECRRMHFTVVQRLLDCAITSLRSLDINVPGPSLPDVDASLRLQHPSPSSLDLSSFDCLESLILIFDVFNLGSGTSAIWNWLHLVLAELASSRLKQLTIYFHIYYRNFSGMDSVSDIIQDLSPGVDDHAFARLDELLAGVDYHHLQTICFNLWFNNRISHQYIPSPPTQQLWFQFLSCRLPKLTARESCSGQPHLGPYFQDMAHILSLPVVEQDIVYLLCTVSLGAILVHLVPYIMDPRGLRTYPGPFFAKFTDVWLGLTIFSNTWSETVDSLHKKHGALVRIGPNHVSIADPAALPLIYGHSSGALKAPYYDVFVDFKHASMFSTRSRAEHARKRRIVSHMFAPKNVRALESTTRVHFAKFVNQWDTLCKCIEGSTSDGTMGSSKWTVKDGRVWFNCMIWFSFWSFDTISDLAFGSPFGMIPAAKDETWVVKHSKGPVETFEKSAFEMEKIPVISVLAAGIEINSVFGFLPSRWRPLAKWHPRIHEGTAAVEKLAGLSITSVSKRLANPEAREDMLQKLLEGRDEDGSPMGPDELAAEALLLIIAGADTVANTSCATVFYLGRHLDVQAKLQAELDDALACVDSDVAPYEAIKDLPYLDAVINEVLRLHSTVGAGLPRVVPEGGLNVLGQTLKEGTWVSVPVYNLHRSTKIWGEDAGEFVPERWINVEAEAKAEMTRAFAPFSIGPRACIGRNLATMQLHIMVATIFHRYSFLVEGDGPLLVQDSFVRKPKDCIVGIKRRAL